MAATPSASADIPSSVDVQTLRSEFDEIGLGDELHHEGQFFAAEIDRPSAASKVFLKKLCEAGAIQVVDEQKRGEDAASASIVNVYEWRDGVLEYLREYKKERAELPCGHRAHINRSHDGAFGCRYCDEDRDFGRETVREAMAE